MKHEVYLIAAMVLIASFVTVAAVSDDSEGADGAAGSVNVYIYDDGSWTMENETAYNALLALMSTDYYAEGTNSVVTGYTYTYTYYGVEYLDISSDYGTITTLNGKTNGDSDTWNLLVYTNTDTGFSWKYTSDGALGWYKPFEDYADYLPSYGTANIALYYGSASDSGAMISSLEDAISSTDGMDTISLTAINKTQESIYEYTFYLRINNGAEADIVSGSSVLLYPQYQTISINQGRLNSGVTIVGYGSDMALALIDAVGSSNASFYSSTSPVPGYDSYGWMDMLYGLGTSYTENEDGTYTYTYWASYTTYGTSSVYADFCLGAYSSLTNAPLVQSYMALIYS